jgi:hypothetical protein
VWILLEESEVVRTFLQDEILDKQI